MGHRIARSLPSQHAAIADLLTAVYIGEGYVSATRSYTAADVETWAERAAVWAAVEVTGGESHAVQGEAVAGLPAGGAAAVIGVVGLALGGRGFTRVAVAGEAEVQRLAVAKRSRRSGVARALMDECVRGSREARVECLVLWTRPVMTAAQRLYEGMGFRRAPQRDSTDSVSRRLVYELEMA